jgi:hypothetical protein
MAEVISVRAGAVTRGDQGSRLQGANEANAGTENYEIIEILNYWVQNGIATRPLNGPGHSDAATERSGEPAGAGVLGRFPCVNAVDGTYPGTKIPLYNACDTWRVAVFSWVTGALSRHPVPPKSQVWIEVQAYSGRQVDDVPLKQMPEDLSSVEGVEPPEDIRELVAMLLDRSGLTSVVERKQIPRAVIRLLDEYASSVHQTDCQINAIYGCGSCCNSGNRANLVDSTCGWMCWTCANEPCG